MDRRADAGTPVVLVLLLLRALQVTHSDGVVGNFSAGHQAHSGHSERRNHLASIFAHHRNIQR